MTQAPTKPELSVIAPAYNEEEALPAFVERLDAALEKVEAVSEILLIDDGSSDQTRQAIVALAERFPRVRGLSFARNFGKEAAVLAGLNEARGRAVVVMDSDGQHPPERIADMLAIWRTGEALIVAGIKSDRGRESLFQGLSARLFYALMRRLSGMDLAGGSDFQLLDRRVVDTLLAFPERVRFFRGLTRWTGYKTRIFSFEVEERMAGETKWSTRALISYALRNLTAFSSRPLRLITYLGFAGLFIAALLTAEALWSRIQGQAVEGWASTTIVILFFGSAQLLAIALLAAYVSRIYEEVKHRPFYVIGERIEHERGKSEASAEPVDEA